MCPYPRCQAVPPFFGLINSHWTHRCREEYLSTPKLAPLEVFLLEYLQRLGIGVSMMGSAASRSCWLHPDLKILEYCARCTEAKPTFDLEKFVRSVGVCKVSHLPLELGRFFVQLLPFWLIETLEQPNFQRRISVIMAGERTNASPPSTSIAEKYPGGCVS